MIIDIKTKLDIYKLDTILLSMINNRNGDFSYLIMNEETFKSLSATPKYHLNNGRSDYWGYSIAISNNLKFGEVECVWNQKNIVF